MYLITYVIYRINSSCNSSNIWSKRQWTKKNRELEVTCSTGTAKEKIRADTEKAISKDTIIGEYPWSTKRLKYILEGPIIGEIQEKKPTQRAAIFSSIWLNASRGSGYNKTQPRCVLDEWMNECLMTDRGQTEGRKKESQPTTKMMSAVWELRDATETFHIDQGIPPNPSIQKVLWPLPSLKMNM